MLTKVRRRLEQEEGFTLIELLVVVLIIGILAAVAIPTFLSQKNKANDSNGQSNLKNAQTIVESFAAGNGGVYPQVATASLLNTSILTGNSDISNVASSGNPVFYKATGGTTTDSYIIVAPGAQNNGQVAWYEIQEANGVTTYGSAEVAQTDAPSASTAADAAAAITAIGTPTASSFPSVTP